MNDTSKPVLSDWKFYFKIIVLVFVFKIFFFIWFKPGGNLTGYTDKKIYYEIAEYSRQGYLPYKSYWREYPPLFCYSIILIDKIPFLKIYGSDYRNFEFKFDFLSQTADSLIILSIILITLKLGFNREKILFMILTYILSFWPIYVSVFSFDVFVVLTVMLSVLFLLYGKYMLSGIFLSLGFLMKLYPLIFVIPFIIKIKDRKDRILFVSSFIMISIILMFPFLFGAQLENLNNFLIHNITRPAWFTVYALINGNFMVGQTHTWDTYLNKNYFENIISGTGYIQISASMIFIIIYFYLNFKQKKSDDYSFLVFLNRIILVFFIFYKGWSPQFILWMLPVYIIIMKDNFKDYFFLISLIILVYIETVFYVNISHLNNKLLIQIPVILRTLLFAYYSFVPR